MARADERSVRLLAAVHPRPPVALLFASAGAVAAAGYVVSSPVAKAVLVAGVFLAAAGAVALGIRRYRPSDPLPWLLVGAMLLVWVVAWILWELPLVTAGAPPAFATASLVVFEAGYLLLAAGLLVLLLRRERDAIVLLDVAVIAVALLAPAFGLLLHEYIHEAALSPFARAVQIVYGVIDVVLLAAAFRVLVSPGPRSRALAGVVAGVVLGVASDLIWNWGTRIGSYTPGSWADLGWFALAILLGAAALGRSMTAVCERRSRVERRLRAGRFALLVAASLVGPVVIAIQMLTGETDLHATLGAAGATVVVGLLVLAQLGLLLRDQGRLARELRARNEQLGELAQIIESTHDAVIAATPDGVVTTWNRGAERLFGWSAEEMIGSPVSRLVPADLAADLEQARARVLAGEPVDPYDTVRVHKDGRRVDVSINLSAVRNRDGRVVAIAAIARDISERKRLDVERERVLEAEQEARAALAEQNKRLRELDRMKDDFVASVSHELRTPLTSIRGYLELVLDGEGGDLTEDQRRFLEVVDRNADRLLRVVGDLLFVAQVNAGKIPLEPSDVDLTAVAREAVDAARLAAEEKEIHLSLHAATALPPFVADKARLAQVLDNLVSNAIKFTPNGGRVDVTVRPDADTAVLEVGDTGTGISREDQARLFERFFRTSAAVENAIQGTGLGLAIVRAIVESHGGDISVCSEVGRGTTFRVELPLAGRARRAA